MFSKMRKINRKESFQRKEKKELRKTFPSLRRRRAPGHFRHAHTYVFLQSFSERKHGKKDGKYCPLSKYKEAEFQSTKW